MTNALKDARKLAKDVDKNWAQEWGMGMYEEDIAKAAADAGADPEHAVLTSKALDKLRRARLITSPASFDWKEQDLLRTWMQLTARRGYKYFYDLVPPGSSDAYVPIASKVKLPLHELG